MRYYLPNREETADDAQDVPDRTSVKSPEHAAQLAADWCHARRGMWESDWPILFVIIDDIGREHRFNVQRHMVPEFEPKRA